MAQKNKGAAGGQGLSAAQRISRIVQMWFIDEPLYFGTYCTHQPVENSRMPVAVRVGCGRLEFCPEAVDLLSDSQLECALQLELLRVMLQHPYQRQPYNADRRLLGLASNLAIVPLLPAAKFPLEREREMISRYSLPTGLCFEDYYYRLQKLVEEGKFDLDDDDDAEMAALSFFTSELWNEDDLIALAVKEAVAMAAASGSGFGSIPGDVIDKIKAAQVPRLDLSGVLRSFKTSILSQRRELTRMRPSRRYGFLQMGSRRPYTTSLLVAIDVSGSVTNHQLSMILGHINRLFKQGIEKIDILQFDCELKLPVFPIDKAKKELNIIGRGGTDFQPVADFYAASAYDGLIICTDGEAPDPEMAEPTPPVIWLEFSSDTNPMFPTVKHGWDRQPL